MYGFGNLYPSWDEPLPITFFSIHIVDPIVTNVADPIDKYDIWTSTTQIELDNISKGGADGRCNVDTTPLTGCIHGAAVGKLFEFTSHLLITIYYMYLT